MIDISNFKVFPKKVDETTFHPLDHSLTEEGIYFLVFSIIGLIIIIIIAMTNGGLFWETLSGLGFIAFIIYFVIKKIQNKNADILNTKNVIKSQIIKSNEEAKAYTEKLTSLLIKSQEIVYQIIPYYENHAKINLEKANKDFRENAFSPFWSKIEVVTKTLAYVKEALTQLSQNCELYKSILSYLQHNFPLPFPFAANISSSLINDFESIVRKAHTDPTFSIIWEQRRNTEVLIMGFKTLENAIDNLRDDIIYSLGELNNSINSGIGNLKYLQMEQINNFYSAQSYLTTTLNSMDNKLYYIQWDKKPLGSFEHK